MSSSTRSVATSWDPTSGPVISVWVSFHISRASLPRNIPKPTRSGSSEQSRFPQCLSEVNQLRKTIAQFNPAATFTVAYTGSWD